MAIGERAIGHRSTLTSPWGLNGRDAEVRSQFPFSDYDFYAYLASGLVFLFALDFAFASGKVLLHNDWTFVEIALAIAVAYGVGQMLAMLSETLLERWLANRVLTPPTALQLGLVGRKGATNRIGRWLAGHYYQPLPAIVRDRILRIAEADLSTDRSALEAEGVFQCAFAHARQNPDAAARLDGFRNQYGFCRNMALATAAAATMIGVAAPSPHAYLLASLLALFSLGLVVRYLKFYAAFGAEVLRTYAFQPRQPHVP